MSGHSSIWFDSVGATICIGLGWRNRLIRPCTSGWRRPGKKPDIGTTEFREHGVKRMWGPGRHLAGNNLFSYYFDPEGNVVEYTTEVEQITNDDYVPPVRPMIADLWGSAPPMAG